jgi:hypothetical protein
MVVLRWARPSSTVAKALQEEPEDYLGCSRTCTIAIGLTYLCYIRVISKS